MNAPAVLAAPDIAVGCRNELGEGPVWDAAGNRLLWVDIPRRELHSLELTGGRHAVQTGPEPISFAAPTGDGQFVLALPDRIVTAAGADEPAVTVAPLSSTERTNDGACDPLGRLWIGTLDRDDWKQHTGSLWRVDERGAQRVIGGVHLTNGIAWSPDGHRMYYVDSWRRTITAYPFEPDEGRVGHGEVITSLPESTPQMPDGLTVDSEGCLWLAVWDGAAVHRHDPDGRLLSRLPLPCDRVTSCAFGGPGLETLFITTATAELPADLLQSQPHAGAVFAASVGVAGFHTDLFRC